YLTLIGRIGADRAGYVTVAIPIVALLLSTAFEGLPWRSGTLLGAGLCVAGTALALRGKARVPQRTRAAAWVGRPESPRLEQLRRYATARSLCEPTTLRRAIARLGFVQADPRRAPARAQDLILAQRVPGYRAGELERRYPRLAIEEAFFINYGF